MLRTILSFYIKSIICHSFEIIEYMQINTYIHTLTHTRMQTRLATLIRPSILGFVDVQQALVSFSTIFLILLKVCYKIIIIRIINRDEGRDDDDYKTLTTKPPNCNFSSHSRLNIM